MKRYVVISAVVLAACGGTSKPAESPASTAAASSATPAPAAAPEATPAPVASTPAFDATMQQALAMFEAMGQAVEDAGEDCGKAAAGIDQVLNDNQTLMANVKRWDAEPTFHAQSDEWMKAHMDQVMAPMVKVATASQTCATDPAFAAVMQRFDDAGK